MTEQDIVQLVNYKVAKSGLALSKLGIEYLQKRLRDGENKGGLSNYWKEVDIKDFNISKEPLEQLWQEKQKQINKLLTDRLNEK